MKTTISSGIGELDQLIGGFLPSDSVVWQTDDLKEYSRFARGFAKRTIADGRECTYLRFASHPRILEAGQGVRVVEVEPGPGFDVFTNRIHGVIQERRPGLWSLSRLFGTEAEEGSVSVYETMMALASQDSRQILHLLHLR
jgi:hypothetical protein